MTNVCELRPDLPDGASDHLKGTRATRREFPGMKNLWPGAYVVDVATATAIRASLETIKNGLSSTFNEALSERSYFSAESFNLLFTVVIVN